MKAASTWNKVRLIGLLCLALAPTLEAQQQPPQEGARRELKLAPEGAEARPVVALVLSVFDALQRRDEAAVLALYEPLPEGLSGLSLPRYQESRRFAVWRHLKRGRLSEHKIQPIHTISLFRSGQWTSSDHFSVIVESQSDSDVGLNLQTRKAISTLQVRRLKDGQYRLSQMEVQQ
jgi:hypothetical protein